jgi:hypothetical protein
MTSPFYEALFDTRISGERDAVSEFETSEGGYRLSTSIGGVLTGRGADIIIIDDPLKADDALSETRRQSVNDWYDNTLRSRLNNQQNGAIIIVMQRLHADDLVAHVQEHGGLERIVIRRDRGSRKRPPTQTSRSIRRPWRHEAVRDGSSPWRHFRSGSAHIVIFWSVSRAVTVPTRAQDF